MNHFPARATQTTNKCSLDLAHPMKLIPFDFISKQSRFSLCVVGAQVFQRLSEIVLTPIRRKSLLRFNALLASMAVFHSILSLNWFQCKLVAFGKMTKGQIDFLLFISFCVVLAECRFNLTNIEEPYFLVESLETLNTLDNIEDRSYKAVIYSVNQKGSSSKVLLKNFIVGDNNPQNACKYHRR